MIKIGVPPRKAIRFKFLGKKRLKETLLSEWTQPGSSVTQRFRRPFKSKIYCTIGLNAMYGLEYWLINMCDKSTNFKSLTTQSRLIMRFAAILIP